MAAREEVLAVGEGEENAIAHSLTLLPSKSPVSE